MLIKRVKKDGTLPKKRKRYKKGVVGCAYAMLSMDIIGFFGLTLYPLLWAVRLSWFSYNGVPSATRFIGWTNYINAFRNDTTYWKAWLTTLQFALCKIPLELPLAIFIAVLLSKRLKGVGFFRTIYFMPHVVSTAIVGLVFSNMFQYFGIINNMIHKNIDWFSMKWSSMLTLVIADTWHTIGVNILYFIAALSNVPEDLKEAARIDGATGWQVFKNVTFPCIAPTFQIILMMSIIGTFGTSDIVLVLTGGAPAGQTYTIMPYITSKFAPGFADATANIGYGSALSVITAVILVLVSVGYNKVTARHKNIY